MLLRTVYTDIKSGKIENKVILVSLIIGSLLNYVTGGGEAFVLGIKAAFITLVSLFVLYMIKGIGAGDVKLFTLIGLLFPDNILMMVMVSFIIAGLMSVTKLIKMWVTDKTIKKGETIHFSIPIAMAVLLVLVKGGI